MALQLHKIATQTVGSSGAATVTFNNIPQGYTDLLVKASTRSSNTAGTGDALLVYFNGATGNFSHRYLIGDGTNTYSGTNGYSVVPTYGWIGYSSAVGGSANAFGNTDMYIPNYTSSNYKTISTDSAFENNATSAAQLFCANLWSSTSAITSMTFLGNTTLQHSTFTLYGML